MSLGTTAVASQWLIDHSTAIVNSILALKFASVA
jgi:hypothetical protein